MVFMSIVSVCLLFIFALDASEASSKTPLRTRSRSVNDFIAHEQRTLEALCKGTDEARCNPRKLKERAKSQLPQISDENKYQEQNKTPHNSPKITAQVIALATSEN